MSTFLKQKPVAISLLLAVAFVIGVLTVSEYGESWDEATLYRYSEYTMQAYRFLLHPHDLPGSNDTLPENGPGYVTAVSILAPRLLRLAPTWSLTTARHFVYFLTFLGGVLAFYLLCRRWLSEAGSASATLLLISQPLFWGHAFINPKDLVFLSFFTATVYAGLKMVDRAPGSPGFGGLVVLVGVLLGIASSLRVTGPVAGLIVLAYGVHQNPRKIILPAVACIFIATAITYLSWPYLWKDPLGHYVQSAINMTQFHWGGLVLFNGVLFQAAALPRLYFPTLIGIQLTEPALILGVFGMALAAVQSARSRVHGPLLVILVWFILPLLMVVGLHSRLYDNGRQLYFILPPLFLGAGLALDRVLICLRPAALKPAVAVIIALPGIVAGANLHPYEYVYYNSLVGGTRGAYQRFEMDYWGTSSKEMIEYVNARAHRRTTVLAISAPYLMKSYARHVVDVYGDSHDEPIRYDYISILIRGRWNEESCTSAPVVHTIDRMGATFAVLRSSPDGRGCVQ